MPGPFADLTQDEKRLLFHLERLQAQGWVPVAAEVLYTRLGSEPDPSAMLTTLVERGYVARRGRVESGSYSLTPRGVAAIESET